MVHLSLTMACINNNLETVEKLISSGADVNIKDKVGWLEVKSELTVIATWQQGRTAAHWTSFKGHHEILSCLLKAGIKADERDQDGKTGNRLAANTPFCHVGLSQPC